MAEDAGTIRFLASAMRCPAHAQPRKLPARAELAAGRSRSQGPARAPVRIAASCSQPTPYIHPAKDEKAERRQRRMECLGADRQTKDAGRLEGGSGRRHVCEPHYA